jgi:hypothetical protein
VSARQRRELGARALEILQDANCAPVRLAALAKTLGTAPQSVVAALAGTLREGGVTRGRTDEGAVWYRYVASGEGLSVTLLLEMRIAELEEQLKSANRALVQRGVGTRVEFIDGLSGANPWPQFGFVQHAPGLRVTVKQKGDVVRVYILPPTGVAE